MPVINPKTKEIVRPVVLDLPEFGAEESFTGEAVKVPRLEVPTIRISYKEADDEGYVAPKGEFIEFDPITKETRALGKKIVIQILHHRQALSAYKELASGSESYYTPEISMKAKSAPLFMAKTGADGKRQQQFLLEGEIKKGGELRTAYPELGYRRSLYVLHEGKLKNLVVYGASFSGYIDFTKAIQGQSSSSVTIELTTTKQKKGTVSYYPITFTPKDKSDMKLIEPTGVQLANWFAEYDKRVAQQQKDRAEQAANDRGDGSADKPIAPAATARVNTMAEEVQGHDDEERAELLEKANEMFGQ